MAKKVSYEEMVEELNEILDKLESNTCTLDESMKEYENGVKLINKLYKTLNNYEGKISIIKDKEEVEFE
ncbi:exodeoxyribonuclease VII small subunit [Clostridium thermobutyricum]|jgi:exodeoxyribonuclease VII small subunit|uniref:Exodeoxyribonuclease 7 small subunit n=1 Tax=Clostridium thermobutyricum DSM 4928 TaxID=1121339 RepID=A0A1V4SV24_9CLOT|nr:exodeoxyribonuclease VII small subunit [Clostridium thermobutyricum]OPX47871.1 exodeoxyribonuclease 7 small subunit [Clostridium thermobutyricum DSM 4928]